MKCKSLISQFLVYASIFILSACSTDDNIKNFVESKSKHLAETTDWYQSNTNIVVYEWQDKDYFANNEILTLAMQYSSDLGRSRQARDIANNYRFSRDPAYSYNPNPSAMVSRYENEASSYEASAENVKIQILNLIQTVSIPEKSDGIWVIWSFSYKEYLGPNRWNGPFEKSYLFLLSQNGKEEKFCRDLTFGRNLFQDFANITGAKYTSRTIN